MNLQLFSYLASLGFRIDLEPETPRTAHCDDAQDAAAPNQTRADISNLKLVLAL
jgi:hypothetical protein